MAEEEQGSSGYAIVSQDSRTLAYSIAADQDRPSYGDGFVRAETIQQAVALIGHPEVNVYPLPSDVVWPGDPGEAVWRRG